MPQKNLFLSFSSGFFLLKYYDIQKLRRIDFLIKKQFFWKEITTENLFLKKSFLLIT